MNILRRKKCTRRQLQKRLSQRVKSGETAGKSTIGQISGHQSHKKQKETRLNLLSPFRTFPLLFLPEFGTGKPVQFYLRYCTLIFILQLVQVSSLYVGRGIDQIKVGNDSLLVPHLRQSL